VIKIVEVGALRVSLGLDSSTFSSGLKNINASLNALNSEFKTTMSGALKFDNSLDALRGRADVLNRTMDTHRAKVEELRRRYDESALATGENSNQTLALANQYNRAVTAMNNTENQLQRVNRQIDEQTNTWLQLQRRMQEAGQSFQNVGDKMKNIGSQMSMKVTAPILALGAAAMKAGADFEEGMDKVAAVSGATGDEFDKLRDLAKKLGAETKFSATEASDGMQFLAMAGFKTNDILAAMPGMLDLAAAGALELGAAADITSNVMSGFGIEATKAGHISDVLAKAAASANTDVSQLGEAMKYLAPSASTLGWTMEEATAAVMALGDAGIQGSLAGQAFGTSLTRLAKNPTPKMKKALDELGFAFFDATGKMKSMPEIVAGLETGMEGWTEKQKAATLTTIFGAEAFKHWAVLLDKGSNALGKNTEMLIGADGAAAQMAKTMSDNTKGQIKTLMSALEGLAIQLSEILLPTINSIVEKLTEWARKFAEFSPEAQKTALVIAAIAAAMGPLLVVTGLTISSIGSIIGVFGAASGAIAAAGGVTAALGTAFTVLTGPIGLTVAAIAGLTVAGIALYKHFQQSSIEVNLWGEGVSEATQKVVGGFLDLNDKVTVALNELSWSGQTVTSEMATEITGIFNQMGDQVLSAMQDDHAEQLSTMQTFFDSSVALSEAEEAEIVSKMQVGQEEQKAIIIEGQTRITEILTTAKEEKRAITDAERQEINAIQEQMKTTAIKHMSENEREQKVIIERLKVESTKITAEQAAEVVANSVKQKEAVVKEAEDQYSKTIAEIIKQRDETGTITAEQADNLIAEANRQKNDTVKNAEEMHAKVVSEAKSQAEEHVNQVDWTTGEVKTKWQAMKDDTAQKMADISSDLAAKLVSMREDTTAKVEEIKTTVSTKFQEIKNSVYTKMGEVKSDIETKWNEAQEFLSDVDLMQIGRDIIQGLINGIGDKITALKNKVSEVANSIPDRIRELLDQHSPSRVLQEVGHYTVDGLILGIGDKVPEVGTAMDGIAATIASKGAAFAQAGASIGQQLSAAMQANVKAPTIPSSSGGGGGGGSSHNVPGIGNVNTDPNGNVTVNTKSGSYDKATGNYTITDNKTGETYTGNGSQSDFDKEYEKHHEGGWVGNAFSGLSGLLDNLKFDEVPAILQTGEFVLSRKMIDNIASLGNRRNATFSNAGNTDNSRVINQNIAIHSLQPLSPSESARKYKQASRQLAMEWG